jgi:hypothetical protein
MPDSVWLSLLDLWLPIVLSALVVFFASFLVWMVFPHHRSDWKGLPDEDAVRDACREMRLEAGQYVFPHASSKEAYKDPAFVARVEAGPSGLLVLTRPGPMRTGRALVLSLLHNLVVSVLVAYLAIQVLPRAVEYLTVFRLTSTAAFLAYAGSWPVLSIWFHQRWSVTLKHVLDAVVYSLLLAGVFAWLWPSL